MQSVRSYEMPACKMVSFGTGMFGEGKLNLFDEWLSSQKRGLFPKDFLFWAGETVRKPLRGDNRILNVGLSPKQS